MPDGSPAMSSLVLAPSPMAIARRRLRALVRKERRLAGVMLLLVGGFTLCYLPFW